MSGTAVTEKDYGLKRLSESPLHTLLGLGLDKDYANRCGTADTRGTRINDGCGLERAAEDPEGKPEGT